MHLKGKRKFIMAIYAAMLAFFAGWLDFPPLATLLVILVPAMFVVNQGYIDLKEMTVKWSHGGDADRV